MTLPRSARRNGTPTFTRRDVLRVVFYLRVSPDESLEEGEETTIENQRGYLTDKYRADFGAHARAGVTPMQYVGEYVDDQVSGFLLSLAERPAGGELLAAARRGEFDAVIVLKIDRFGRKASFMLEAADALAQLGVAIISATEPINTTPQADIIAQAVSEFMFQLLASLAQLDRATFLGRASLGRRRHAKAGRFLSGPVPFGFEIDGDGMLAESGRLIPQLGMSEADLVREVFRRIADGESCGDVADWLNRLGVPSTTRYYHKRERRTHEHAAAFHSSRISRIIRDPIYGGVRERHIHVDTITNDLGFALVEPELQSRAKAALAEPKRHKGRRDLGDDGYLLTGLLVCQGEACASSSRTGRPHVLTGSAVLRQPGNRRYRYYRCAGRTHSGSKHPQPRVCTTPLLNAGQIETAVLDAIEEAVRQPAKPLAQLNAMIDERLGVDNADVGGRHAALNVRLLGLQRARQTIREKLALDRMTSDEYDVAYELNAREMASVKEQLDLIDGRQELAAVERARVAQARSVLDELAEEWDALRAEGGEPLRAKVARLVRRIEVTPEANGDVQIEMVFGFDPVCPGAAHMHTSGAKGQPSGSTGAPLDLAVPLLVRRGRTAA